MPRPALRGALAVLVGLALGVAVTQLGATVLRVSGESMAPTFHTGQLVVVIRPPLHAALERSGLLGPLTADGSVVAVTDPTAAGSGAAAPAWPFAPALLLKRVVATGGQTIAYARGARLLDGAPASEPWLSQGRAGGADVAPVTLTQDELFVVGDDRRPLASLDSRSFGPLPAGAVRGGVAWVLRWPVGPSGWRSPVAAVR